MAEITGVLNIASSSRLRAKVTPYHVINKQITPITRTSVKFDFSPKGAALTYVAGFTVYNPSNAWHVSVNTPITFTGTAIAPSGMTILEYKWTFGDGAIGYGNPIAHTFRFPGSVRVTLRVTDSQNKKTYATTIIYPQ